ncbi:ABC transporter permease [Aureimonas sp. AU4]|uniref:ABC transporter permease n=1 Tax=Aureimonas sp. AU4 TaxID=1638163 RepID=UPI00278C70BE|nr:ABC transporter permease [Aureimonas sp. AU4]
MGAGPRCRPALTRQPRPALGPRLGKRATAGLRALAQAPVVYAAAYLLGVHLSLAPLHVLGVVLTIGRGAALYAMLSLSIACLMKSRERFMGIGQLLTMPIFFASSALYSVTLMPGWLQAAARLNPLTYRGDALRALMIAGAATQHGIGIDLVVPAGVSAALTAVAARLSGRMGY